MRSIARQIRDSYRKGWVQAMTRLGMMPSTDYKTIVKLSAEDWEAFSRALNAPPEPNEKLVRLMQGK